MYQSKTFFSNLLRHNTKGKALCSVLIFPGFKKIFHNFY